MRGTLSITASGDTPEDVLAALKAEFSKHGFPEPRDITLRGPHYGQSSWIGTAKGGSA